MGGGYIVWRGEVRRDTEIRKGRLLYEKKKRTTKKRTTTKKKQSSVGSQDFYLIL